MISRYDSNKSECLATLLQHTVLESPPQHPFTKELIVVPNHGLARWLEMTLAESAGIAANLKFSLPSEFIWYLSYALEPEIETSQELGGPTLLWALLARLPQLLHRAKFNWLKQYLQDDPNQSKLFHTALTLTKAFERYGLYRPEWLLEWKKNQPGGAIDPDLAWQSALWNDLQAHSRSQAPSLLDRASILETVYQKLCQGTLDLEALPSRVSVFGVHSLPPVFLAMLEALSEHIPVSLFMLAPTYHYWGQEEQQAPSPEPSSARKGEISPLLTLLSRSAGAFLDQLQSLSQITEQFFISTPSATCRLHRLQRHLLHGEADGWPPPQAPSLLASCGDDSMTVHACPTRVREVEILHDQLIGFLERDPTLKLRDILILVPTVSDYRPYIRAVFGKSRGALVLPVVFQTPARPIDIQHMEHFLSLLCLPGKRFYAEDVFGILSVSTIYQRFGLSAEEVTMLREWAGELGIYWGLNHTTATQFQLPQSTQRYSFEHGMKRLLLGYAMHPTAEEPTGALFDAVAPWDLSRLSSGERIGKLCQFLDRLTDWHNRLSHPYPLSEWLSIGPALVDAFFIEEEATQDLYHWIRHRWKPILQAGLDTGYAAPIPSSLLVSILRAALEKSHHTSAPISDKITCSDPHSMRGVPFKVICLLGLNEGEYPTKESILPFDLMAKYPQASDPSDYHSQQGSLLDALLSAREKLHLSYLRESSGARQPSGPSGIINAILAYFAQCEEGGESEASIPGPRSIHHLHPPFPFSAAAYSNQKPYLSYAAEWFPSGPKPRDPIPVSPALQLRSPVGLPQVLPLDQLLRFYKDPLLYFFQQQLGMKLSMPPQLLRKEEPCPPKGLRRYQWLRLLLETLSRDRVGPAALKAYGEAVGLLPPGPAGAGLWKETLALLAPLVSAARQGQAHGRPRRLQAQIEADWVIGMLTCVPGQDRLRCHPARLSLHRQLLFWIEHLLYASAGGHGQSILLGIEADNCLFPALEVDTARALLSRYLSAYAEGQQQPLPFFMHSVQSGMESSSTHAHQAYAAFMRTFRGHAFNQGERTQHYARRYAQITDSQYAQAMALGETLLRPMLAHKQRVTNEIRNRWT